MLLAILAFYWGYKKGRDSGRNGALWSVICGGAFLGVQLLVGIGLGAVMGLGIALWGWSPTIFDDYYVLISIAAIVPAVITMLLLFKYLDRVPNTPTIVAPPPPPQF